MTLSHHGIETSYRGYRFRSRAEARWAAFFDLLQWKWSYEPIDLHGYIPDFVLHFHRPLLVEVKGAVVPGAEADSQQIAMACSKIEVSGWEHEALVLGSAPSFDGWMRTGIGLFCNQPEEYSFGADAVLFHCLACDAASVCSGSGSYACRRRGCWDGDHYLSNLEGAEELWAEACNVTRWR